MTEGDARAWIAGHFGPDAADRVGLFLDMVVAENAHQNLIAPSTIAHIWTRHALDSAQLVPLAPADGRWADIGTGGGFPGLVAAILRPGPTLLVEPRRRRAEFLARCVERLALPSVEVCVGKIVNVTVEATVVSARAVASVEKLLLAAERCATQGTRWILPRGHIDPSELDALRREWDGTFHVEQSVSDPQSSILILDGIARR